MRKLPRRQVLRLAGLAATAPFVSRTALAQTYPTRPVKLVVAFTAGGTTDLLARILSPWLSERLGQQIVIENKPGGGTNIAIQLGGEFAAGRLHAGDDVRHQHDQPVALQIAAVRLPARHRAGVGPRRFAAGAGGQQGHTGQECERVHRLRQSQCRASWPSRRLAHEQSAISRSSCSRRPPASTPFTCRIRADRRCITDLISGRIQAGMDALPNSLPHIRSGTVRALAVMSPQRNPAIPEVPTISEIIPGLEFSAGTGIGAPSGDARRDHRAPQSRYQRMSRRTPD